MKKIVGYGLVAAIIAGLIYIITQEPGHEGGPEIDMTLDWKEIQEG